MKDMERDLRDMMHQTAGGSHHVPRPSRGLVRRARLRRVRTAALTGAAAVALVIGGFAGVRSLSTERGSIQPADDNVSPSEPTPSEAWTGPCLDSQDGPPPSVCLGPLDEGTYTSQRLEPALTFTVPAGWNNPWDTRGAFSLWTPGWSDGSYMLGHPGVSVRRDPRPDEGCSPHADATAVGTSALEVATWVANHPAIATEAPSPVEVAGLTGYLLDVSLADTWRESCPGGPAAVWVFEDLYLRDQNKYPEHATMRLILLDLPDGGSVLVAIDGTQVDAAMPVVRSFEFDLS